MKQTFFNIILSGSTLDKFPCATSTNSFLSMPSASHILKDIINQHMTDRLKELKFLCKQVQDWVGMK